MPPIVPRLLFAFSRSRGLGIAVRWAFAHAAFALPLRRVAETPWAVAFPHPRPDWPFHILVVPKAGVASLLDPSPRTDDTIARMVDLAGTLAPDRHSSGTAAPVAFLINAGAFQNILQIHGHPIAAPDLFSFHAGARSVTSLWTHGKVEISRVSPGWRLEHVSPSFPT
jgi:diadenosine tetraphosphate (Ap4A) HIT family hydrolase